MRKKPVVTGCGVVSPIGIGIPAFWDGLFSGKTGFREITLFDPSPFGVRTAGEIVDFDPVAFLGKKGLRDLDRSTRLVNAAAHLAIEESAVAITEENARSYGVSIGTTFGSLHSIFQFDREGLINGPRFVNPSHFPNTVINSPASRISIRFGIKGFNTTISTGFCSGIDAVAYAAEFIRLNRADAVLTGAVEELCEELFAGFATLDCLAGTDGSEPLSCPFDKRRNGVILSEGAVVFVIEDEERAKRRGATILARILGCGNAFDPHAARSFHHRGEGSERAIVQAMRDASLEKDEIDYIASSANSSRGLDALETRAIKAVFGERAYRIPVSAVKSMIGESYSASGAFAIAAAIGAFQRNAIFPTVNYRDQDPACDLDYVPNASRSASVRTALVIATDPYGNNSAVILGKYP